LEPKIATFSGHRDCVYALCRGPKENEFFSAGADGAVVLWNVDDTEKGKMIVQVPSSIYAIHYFPETNTLLIAANRDGLHLIDLESGLESWKMSSPTTNWFRIEALNSEQIILSGSSGSLANLNSTSWTINWLATPVSDNRAIAVHQNSGEIAFGNSIGNIGIFKSSDSNPLLFQAIHKNTVFGLAFYPDGERLISCGRDGHLVLWTRYGTGNWHPQVEIPAHLFGIHDVKIHPEKPILATCSMDKTLKIWDAENLKLLRVLDKTRHAGHGHSVNQVLWLGKRELLLSCSDDRTISAWDIYR